MAVKNMQASVLARLKQQAKAEGQTKGPFQCSSHCGSSSVLSSFYLIFSLLSFQCFLGLHEYNGYLCISERYILVLDLDMMD